ncbi:hypothetical protein ABTX82_18385 [Streptomyces lavendulae]|uniref:hypothetical protein n=1 Tax=Streptomyces lavendulae TaxID=1914 RepID=UPI0024A1FAF4|nr:hypothetical protein [Streptomyces lavendulae]GLW03901.1 hypothetical protein Slala05_75310 [Streptomyces lavendulae subsp. lavendulae]
MSQYDEYSTPSQAEGERLDEDMDEQQRKQRQHPQTMRTTPSQAEGERLGEEKSEER